MKTAALLALALVLGSASLGRAHNSKTAFAIPVSGIAIDGQLGDWPKGMETFAIAEVSQCYSGVPPAGPQDFSGFFQAGYDTKTNTLYLAVVVEDDELATHPEAPDFKNQDLCEVYIDADHSGKDKIVTPSGMSQYMISPNSGGGMGAVTNSAAGAQQYMMVPGPGVAFDKVNTNPALVGDDQHQSGMRAAYGRQGTTTVYEWAIPLFASFPGTPFEARAGKTIGFDVAVTDADGSESGNWISWAPGANKVFNADLYGNLRLIKNYQELGTLAGTLTSAKNPGAGLTAEVYQQDQLVASVRTDAQGRYRLRLLPGEYTLKLKRAQGYAPAAAKVAVRKGKEAAADLALTPIAVPEVLKQMAVAYQALRTYRDTTVVEESMVRMGATNGSTSAMSFAYARPDQLRLEGGGQMGAMALVSDGKVFSQYMGMFKQYTQKKAPAVFAVGDFQGQMGLSQPSLFHRLMFSQDPLKVLMEGLEQAVEQGQEQLDGTAVVVVELMQSLSSMGNAMVGQEEKAISVRLWIGAQDHLLRQLAYEIDLSANAKNLPAEAQASVAGMKRGYVERHTAVQVNPDLPAETFTFTPPAEASLVETLGFPGMMPPNSNKFVGKPAPAFTLRDLEDQETKLADFAGKVLIVDFWATWCEPCRVEIPTFTALQSLYAEKGFSVIGLSADDQAQTVRNFTERTKISYPLLMADDKVRQDYGNITALPTTFLVDRKGVVRYTHIGAPPDMLVLQKQVEELLGE